MTPTSHADLESPDARGVARNRVNFLTEERADPDSVRSPILASWQRSRRLQVPADRIEMPYRDNLDIDTPLTRSAEPVLKWLHSRLTGQAVSIVLTDQTGLVLSRRTTDAELERHLDRVLLAPGFNYAEQFVGTNGIGTALEAGAGTQVYGHEHYAEHLENLACAGVPIHDPISGWTVGAVDLTCWRKDAQSMLLTLAEATAEQIRRAMLNDSGVREFEVLQAYRRTCRRTTGIVFAITTDAVLLNDHARAELDPTDQAALLAHAGEAAVLLPAGRRRSVRVTLPSGASAQMFCQQVAVDSEPAGLVVHVKLSEAEVATTTTSVARPSANKMLLPGLVGGAPLWQRACTKIEEAFSTGSWLIAQGEAGVGKLAILRAVQLRAQPARRFTVLDASQAASDRHWIAKARTTLAEEHDSVIIAHLDALDGSDVRAVTAALQDAVLAPRSTPLWVGATMRQSRSERPGLEPLLRLFPTTIDVPPLRLRLEDVPQLVTFLLAKLGRGTQVSCSSEALRLLMRSSWPGNVEQVQQLLLQVMQHRRSGVIAAGDLPVEMLSMSRRVLTPIEAMERDAIAAALADAAGNKVQAARALGMSRATIYRKIHEYGIVAQG